MARTIFEKLEKGIGREIDNMPYGLTKRQMRRLVDRALEKVIRKVGRECGIPNADIEETKKVFWDCDMSFPNFDDECYTQVMQGMKGWRAHRLFPYEQIRKPTKNGLRDFTNDFLVDNEWGANYDPRTKTMLGGYSEDGVQFHPCFRIIDIEEDDVLSALTLCAIVSKELKLEKIDATLSELLEITSNCPSMKGHTVTI